MKVTQPKRNDNARSRRRPRGNRAVIPQQRSTQTRLRILNAAATLFRDRGYKATTLRDIAERAKLGAGSMYYYFSSKEQMVQEVLDRGITVIDESVRSKVKLLSDQASAAEQIREALRAHLRALLQTGDYSTAYVRIYNQLPTTVKRRDDPRRVAYLGYWHALMQKAQRQGSVRSDLSVSVFVDFLMGSMSRAPEWYDPESVSIDQLADWIADWMFFGISVQHRS